MGEWTTAYKSKSSVRLRFRRTRPGHKIPNCTVSRSVLDFNPITTIASHMAYWGDEDVSHFVMSQMLSSKTQTPRPK